METTIIIGGGHAGGEAALSLRQGGYAGRIVLICEEHGLPYQRPPLSKAFLLAPEPEASLIRPAANFSKADIEIASGIGVQTIDRQARSVTLSDGSRLSWDHLIIATGSRPRQLALPDPITAQPTNLHYLRNLTDAQRLKGALQPDKKLLIIGGGYIGLEVASAAQSLGLQVTIIEAQERILSRVTAPEVSAFYQQVHQAAGIQMLTGVQITTVNFSSDGTAIRSVTLQNGDELPTDVVLAGIGAIPETGLAESAGLEVDNGILVNEFCQTSDPAIYAIGDCSNHPSKAYQRRIRLESVPNAVEQARVAAQSINGSPKPYESIPWFWSDQYDLKLQMVGLSQGYDQVVIRGNPEERSFAAFYFANDKLIAADCVSRPSEFGMIRKLVQAGTTASSAAALANIDVALKDLL
ncbi:MAG TPA: pyridine nucleotide-disulfide oxidoreductase [Pseudomonas xinjiangensis]|uniref:Pyridine nucleotide-disulfide oxidoreductase n=2 Tax=root TaxID=1 RepID=A0A7V1BLC7_9GAMM|nr:pyridine nucleotide-disulfide oxidoreductase [Halopseudomonas xinjiangensis]HEC47566.1 pyridine nucleotide-disulfide oxidoreductase [Halopseudomonas xinjiangensis]